jgi:hypothetical protein
MIWSLEHSYLHTNEAAYYLSCFHRVVYSSCIYRYVMEQSVFDCQDVGNSRPVQLRHVVLFKLSPMTLLRVRLFVSARNAFSIRGHRGTQPKIRILCAMSIQFTDMSPIDCLRTKFPSSNAGWRSARWSFMQTEEWLEMEYEVNKCDCPARRIPYDLSYLCCVRVGRHNSL